MIPRFIVELEMHGGKTGRAFDLDSIDITQTIAVDSETSRDTVITIERPVGSDAPIRLLNETSEQSFSLNTKINVIGEFRVLRSATLQAGFKVWSIDKITTNGILDSKELYV